MGWMEGFGVPGFLLYPTIAIGNYFTACSLLLDIKQNFPQVILAFFCLATAFIFHYDFADQMQLIAFLKNIGLAGGFLFIVANGTGEWSFDRKKKYVRL